MIRAAQVTVGCFLAWLSLSAYAAPLQNPIPYYPKEFYQKAQANEDLKGLLYRILSEGHVPGGDHDKLVESCKSSGESNCYQHISLGYDRARRILFGQLHLMHDGPQYAVKDVYCERITTAADFHSQPPGPDQIPDPDVLNAEHTWPQSRFSKSYDKGMQKSDLHILYPVMAVANSTRGNIKFSDVVSPVAEPCEKSRRGYASRGQNESFFEVPAAHKGNVARAIFYFSVRYKMPVTQEEEDSLKSWARLDPVDQAERDRNEAIFAKQKVRNPFIDHPELIELISDF